MQDVPKHVERMLVAQGVKTFFFNVHSSTFPVETWLEDRRLFVACSTHYHVCSEPDTIKHVFMDCWSGGFFLGHIAKSLEKRITVNSTYDIHFLSVKY